MNWSGDYSFLNSGKSLWSGPRVEQSLITWKFTKYTDRLFPFSFFECEIEGWGHTAIGYGVSRNENTAAQKSFGEAWERLWLTYLHKNNSLSENILSSNGFAAGKTNEMALQNSKNELIERAVLLMAWSEQMGWKPAKIKNFKNKLLIWGLWLKGWRISFFEINSNLGTVSTCLARHPKLGAIFDSAYCKDMGECEEKLLLSVVKNSFFQIPKTGFQIPEFGHPEDHRKFYSDVQNMKAFDFLFMKDSHRDFTYQIHDQDKIASELMVHAGTFPGVAYSTNINWPQLTWGLQSIQGKGRWPHPLA